MPLEDIVSVQITAQTATPARAGFGVPLLLAYHSKYVDRVREYSSPQGLIDDGFATYDPVYKMAQKVCGQRPHPKKFKVGRRALPPTQTVRLTPTLTTEGLVIKFSIIETDFEYTIPAAATVASICTALTALINASLIGGVTAVDGVTWVTVTANVAVDLDAIATAAVFIGGAAPVEILAAAFDGVVSDAIIYPPRIIEVVFNADTDWDATNLLVTGLDEDGLPQTENIAIPNGGGATVLGVKLWSQITKLNIPAQTAACSGTVGLGPAAGALFSYSVETEGGLELRDVTTDPGVATDIAAVVAADDKWYGLLLDSNSEAEIEAAAADIEARFKMLFANTADSRVKVAAETTDVASDLQDNSYVRTAILWNNDTLGYAACAWAGRMLPTDPGSETWAFKTLAGVPVDVLSDSEVAALKGKDCNYYVDLAEVSVTLNGVTPGHEYVDVTRFVDWLTARMKENVFALFVNNDKVPYTDLGVDLVRGTIMGVLDSGVKRGGLAADPAPTVDAPLVADIDAADKAARHLPDVHFSGTLAGAIHSVDIQGVVSV